MCRMIILTTASYDVNFGFRSGAVNVIKAPLLPIVSLKRSNFSEYYMYMYTHSIFLIPYVNFLIQR